MPKDKEGKFKGYAFVECENNEQFQKVLKLHHGMLRGRRVNIEFTAGGGGNSAGRKEKIRNKNKKLLKFRQALFKNSVNYKNTHK